MKPDIFATRALSPRDQFEAWREWYSSVFEVIPTDPVSDGFPGAGFDCGTSEAWR